MGQMTDVPAEWNNHHSVSECKGRAKNRDYQIFRQKSTQILRKTTSARPKTYGNATFAASLFLRSSFAVPPLFLRTKVGDPPLYLRTKVGDPPHQSRCKPNHSLEKSGGRPTLVRTSSGVIAKEEYSKYGIITKSQLCYICYNYIWNNIRNFAGAIVVPS